jgi:hypothetical protein
MVQFLCQKINKLLKFTENSSGICTYMLSGKLMSGMKIRQRLVECLWCAFLNEKCVYVQKQVAKRKHDSWGTFLVTVLKKRM